MHLILVEGKADKKFIEDLISTSRRINADELEIKIANGYSEIPKLKNIILEIHDHGGKVLILLDADNNPVEKRKMIEQLSDRLGLPLFLYLFPDNKNNGDLEDLLLECVRSENKKIIECFECYESCLIESGSYNTPNKKAKVYAYCEALCHKNKCEEAKEEKRNYLNEEIWNLNNDNTNKLLTYIESTILSGT